MGGFIEWLVTCPLARFFPERYRVVPRIDDGRPMLRQFRLFSWCYLQSFCCEDQLEQFHRHRWGRMYSIVLSGSFVEERYPGELYIPHSAPSLYTMTDTVIHRIAYVAPRTWTLFFMLGNSRQWGYYRRPEYLYTPWYDAVPKNIRVKSFDK